METIIDIDQIKKLDFLNESQVELLTDIKRSTLQNWRHKKRGFPYVKIGKRCLYRWADVQEYLESRIVQVDTDI